MTDSTKPIPESSTPSVAPALAGFFEANKGRVAATRRLMAKLNAITVEPNGDAEKINEGAEQSPPAP